MTGTQYEELCRRYVAEMFGIPLELGCDAVLMNTAIAGAKDALLMAEAMRLAVEAGRKAFLAGRIPAKLYATAPSPLDGLIR